MPRPAWLVALLAPLWLWGCAPIAALNALVPQQGFERHAGIAYGDAERQRLDVYVPRAGGDGPRPVVVFFYGGRWQSGSRGDFLFVAEALTAMGFVAVVPDYRLYPEVRYPAFVEDAAAAVAWTAAHAARYGGDPAAVTLMGHSSGAHLAAMLATNRRFLDAGVRARLVGLVGLAGPYDFIPDDPVVETLLAGEGDSRLAMPARYVRGGEPPALLLTGRDDETVSPENTEKLARALEAARTPVQVVRYADFGHVAILARLAAPLRDRRLYDDIAAFVRARSAAARTPTSAGTTPGPAPARAPAAR